MRCAAEKRWSTVPDQAAARLAARVGGFVQGVGFRAYTEATAANLGLTGWVRNTPGGEVEVLAEGSQDQLVKFLALLRRGPRASRVTYVEETWGPATGEFSYFSVRSTYGD